MKLLFRLPDDIYPRFQSQRRLPSNNKCFRFIYDVIMAHIFSQHDNRSCFPIVLQAVVEGRQILNLVTHGQVPCPILPEALAEKVLFVCFKYYTVLKYCNIFDFLSLFFFLMFPFLHKLDKLFSSSCSSSDVIY